MSAVLALDGIRVLQRGHPVLDGLTLSLDAGECRALIGLNGAGKTTALRVVLGMSRADAGTATVLGTPVAARSRRVWSAVGHLIETPFCYPELTARENLALAAALHGAEPRWAARRAEQMADLLGLDPWLDTPVRRQSLGTRQKVGLIGALAHEPDLAVLDEPTNGLDPLAVVAFREILAEVVHRGGAVLVTSHHFDELARVADRVDVLHRGRIVDSSDPRGADLEARFFDIVVRAERGLQAAS